jgi:hypothetical protein
MIVYIYYLLYTDTRLGRLCTNTEKIMITLISKELDSVPKYHILEPT